jgi:hypothetical protein
MWLLLLELHQQAFHQEAFEEAAVNYAITFEVSPPSWEALAGAGTRRVRQGPEQALAKAEGFACTGRCWVSARPIFAAGCGTGHAR